MPPPQEIAAVPPPQEIAACEYCDQPLEQFRYIGDQLEAAVCEFCRQPHRITEDGAWVAVDRGHVWP